MPSQEITPADELFDDLYTRFHESDSKIQVTQDELLDLGVATTSEHGTRAFRVDNESRLAGGSMDAQPIAWHLVRVGSNQYLGIKHLYRLIDSPDKFLITGIGDVEVTAKPLGDDFGEEHELSDELISEFREAYLREAEYCWEFVAYESVRAAAFTGSRLYVEPEEPWLGLSHHADRLDLDTDTWLHEVKRSIIDARPSGPTVLNATMSTAFVLDLTFK